VNLSLGSQVQIEFLPPRRTERVQVCGIVRHRALYLYGIEFLLDTDQRQGNGAEVATITDRQDVRASELVIDH
jgi:hypothetical protein